jgi:pimeloyl-ACP methyl ester carboxylesterase
VAKLPPHRGVAILVAVPYVTNRGVNLYWDERGSGPPVLLIMGLSFTHDMWFRVLPFLSRHYRTIFFDNRGMGRSDVPKGPYRMRLMAQDAAAVLDAAGVPAAHIIGASMGGMIAQELALRHPHRVLSLLLGCTSYGGLLARWPSFSHAPRNLPLGENARMSREQALIPLLYSPSTAMELIEEDLRVRSGCSWSYRGFWGQFGGILMWNSYWRLPRIKAPTLVVHGADDKLVPPVNGRVVAKRIPGARFELLPKAGHILVTDQLEACVGLMLEFLGKRI